MTTGYDHSRLAAHRLRDPARPLPPALSWTVLCAFVVGFSVAYALLDLPLWMPALYGALSVVAVAAYRIDKVAARSHRRRISEQTLLALGLFSGWPGALIAQQLFRHKSRKRSFRRAFWCTVVINVAALTGLIAFATLKGIALELPLDVLLPHA